MKQQGNAENVWSAIQLSAVTKTYDLYDICAVPTAALTCCLLLIGPNLQAFPTPLPE